MNVTATLGATLTEQVTATLKNAAAQKYGDPVLDRVYAQAHRVQDALVSAGLSEPAATFALFQAYHETGAFTSPLYLQHNNASGIKYAGQSGALKGSNGYAWWSNLSGWATAMRHELTKGSNPAGAKTIEDYANRLKANRYYQDTVDNYLHGLTRARLLLKSLPAEQRAGVQPDGSTQAKQDLDIPGSTDYTKAGGIMDMFKNMSTPVKVGLAALGVILVIKIVD